MIFIVSKEFSLVLPSNVMLPNHVCSRDNATGLPSTAGHVNAAVFLPACKSRNTHMMRRVVRIGGYSSNTGGRNAHKSILIRSIGFIHDFVKQVSRTSSLKRSYMALSTSC
jgi:hypothetical protein